MSDFWFVDLVSTYLYILKLFSILIGVVILISGIDDLFIDIVYWSRLVWRKLTIYKKHKPLGHEALYEVEEQPLVIMVPAWQETGVIGKMAELAATRFDYENYQIFVGTYPNDPDTQRDVDEVCARFPNVHKVICARPGPTSKADCLNNILDAILRFEKTAGLAFAGFILHDAEDVISDMELRLFNYLVGRKDLIQIPVYPLEKPWYYFTSLHYLDEFAEVHAKDIPVREWLSGQVPSAGVGTCFSRRAILALLADGDGIAFDVQSLTEDYDIGFRLKQKGMREIFVRFPVIRHPKTTTNQRWVTGMNDRVTNVICVREYFPETFHTAVRQKSRWIIGIIYQGMKTHKWGNNWMVNYFLWRDRKGGITNFLSFMATLILLQLFILLLYQTFWPDPYHFLSIFTGDPWLISLIWFNAFLMTNRIIQRTIFVSGYYGIRQGLLSIPRQLWSSLINFMANWRAVSQVIKQGDPRRVAWDKTSHDFPSLEDKARARQPLGEILVERGSLSPEKLNTAIASRPRGIRIGSWLVHQNIITAAELAAGMAQQSGVEAESVDAYQIPPEIIERIPAKIALHYGVLPIRIENDTLILASESYIDPVSLGALSRKLKSKLIYHIAKKGQVTVGLRHWYARRKTLDPRQLLEKAQTEFGLTPDKTEEIWHLFVSRQLMLGEILMSLGHIDEATMRALLLRHERSDKPLAAFLIDQNIISEQTLQDALNILQTHQADMPDLLRGEGIPDHWIQAHIQEMAN